jgi:phage/plasmid-like protein (TIGR03299 family)
VRASGLRRLVWALAVVGDKVIRIPGDDSEILPYIILTTGHDALHAFRVKNSPTRVVCRNTLDAAIRGAGREVIIRHTLTGPDRIAVAKAAKKFGIEYFEAFEATAAKLVEKKLTLRDVIAFTEKLLPTKEDAERTAKTQAQRDFIIEIVNRADNLVDMPMNGWRVYNAVAQYVDHRDYRATKLGSAEDARALAILDGSAQQLKDAALELLIPAGRGPGGRFARTI